MARYRRVTLEARCLIESGLHVKLTKAEIARRIGCHRSTVCREIRRNATNGYWARSAMKMARLRFRSCRRRPRLEGWLKDVVSLKMREQWSPEQIAGRLRVECKVKVSHETIYRFLRSEKKAGGNLWSGLRRYKRKSKGRYAFRKHHPVWMRKIRERPEVINHRSRFGDWERDTMHGRDKKMLLVLVERRSRYMKIGKPDGTTAHEMGFKTKDLLSETFITAHSLTNDNGSEFRDGYLFKIPVYYCEPRKPQQRGTVENAIGLLRQYIDNQADLATLNDPAIKDLENKLNLRPRKILDYKTPYEVLYGKTVALVS